MFTGLIQSVCTVRSSRRSSGTMQLGIDLGPPADETKIGDSIAVNGVCLTAAKLNQNIAMFEVSTETLAKSTLAKLKTGSQVNVELALKADGRFGGHFVQGHIDGTATVKAINRQGQFADIKFSAEPELLDQMVVKGSVAVDGISLTITDMDEKGFSVAVIPQTLKKTTLGRAKIGDEVNVENDIIVKAVKKQLEKIMPQKKGLTVDKLKELGF